MDILRAVRARGERALVFIEHERLQGRFVAVAKLALGRARLPDGEGIDAVIATHADHDAVEHNQGGPPVIYAGGRLASLWPEFVATGAAMRSSPTMRFSAASQ